MARARWYVIQVLGGQEGRSCTLIEAACTDMYDNQGVAVLSEVFCPRYITRRKYKGEWREVERSLLPGYVIAVTSNASALRERLWHVNALTKLLMFGGEFVPLRDEERAWIEENTAKGNRVIPLSIAVKDGDSVVVTEGPLKGHEAQIIRINRRKCVATLELNVGGKRVTTQVGLAVLSGEQVAENIG